MCSLWLKVHPLPLLPTWGLDICVDSETNRNVCLFCINTSLWLLGSPSLTIFFGLKHLAREHIILPNSFPFTSFFFILFNVSLFDIQISVLLFPKYVIIVRYLCLTYTLSKIKYLRDISLCLQIICFKWPPLYSPTVINRKSFKFMKRIYLSHQTCLLGFLSLYEMIILKERGENEWRFLKITITKMNVEVAVM